MARVCHNNDDEDSSDDSNDQGMPRQRFLIVDGCSDVSVDLRDAAMQAASCHGRLAGHFK